MKKLLYLSSVFANKVDFVLGTYNVSIVKELSKYSHVDVMAPVSWIDALKNPKRLESHEINGFTVHHPVYFYLPRMSASVRGWFMYASCAGLFNKLAKKHDYDVVFSAWLYPDGWVGSRFAKRIGAKSFIRVLGSDVNRLAKGSALANNSLDAISNSEGVVCVSSAIRERLKSLGAPGEKLRVIYNGLDEGIFHPRDKSEALKACGLDSADRHILYVGNLKKDKGVGELAQAFVKLSRQPGNADVKLVIIGEGNFKAQAQEILAGVLDKCLFKGFMPSDRIAVWMCACDVLCLPSYAEGMPNVILEGIASGCKMVATSVGGIPELVNHTENLLLVPPKTVDELAQALEASLNSPRKGQSSWHSWEKAGREYAGFFGLTGLDEKERHAAG